MDSLHLPCLSMARLAQAYNGCASSERRSAVCLYRSDQATTY